MSDRFSDLKPQLGWPGGVCHTVQRIEDKVRSPQLREKLVDKVEDGDKLTNPEAQSVYRLEVEKGTKAKLIQTIRIVPHAQYRMDQRSITVLDLRLSLGEFVTAFYNAKSQGDYQFKDWEEALKRGEPIRWVSSASTGRLVVVFASQGQGAVNIISTFWDGEPDPRPQDCEVPRQAGYRGDPQGYRTFVKDPHPQKSDTDSGAYKLQGLPAPWSRSKPVTSPTTFNGPGPSGTAPGGRSVHKDMARTKGVPGQKHPDTPARRTPVRRPGLEASDEVFSDEELEGILAEMFKISGMYPPAYPTGAKRQRAQRGQAKRYFRKQYRRTRGKSLMRAKRRYKRLKNNGRFRADRKRRRKSPERFTRKPGGGALSVADRSKKYREKQKRQASALLSPIPFVFMPTEEEGEVRSVSPDGMVTFTLAGRFEQLPFDTFMDEAFIYDEADLEEFFAYLDDLVGFDLDGAMDALEEGEEDDEDDNDPYFDAWNEEGIGKVAISVQFRARPKKRQRRQRGQAKVKQKQYYRKNKARAKLRSRMRYKRVKTNPAFKRQQKHRRRNKNLFKRRNAQVLTVPEIAFVIGRTLDLGIVHSVSPMTGLVTYHRRYESGLTDRFESMAVARFLYSAVFLTDEDTDAFFELVDAELDDEVFHEVDAEALRGGADLVGIDCDDPAFQAQCDTLVGHHDLEAMTPTELDLIDSRLITRFTYGTVDDLPHDDEIREEEEADPYLLDPTDDDLFYGKVWLEEEYENVRSASYDPASWYYSGEPGLTLQTIMERWQENSPRQKLLDDAQPIFLTVRELWPLREFTWTRDKARNGFARVQGKNIWLPGPEKWDVLKENLRESGWDADEPLYLEIGSEGGIKVGEGNHRLALAKELGLSKIPVQIYYRTGKVTKSPMPSRDPIEEVSQRAVTKAIDPVKLQEKLSPEAEQDLQDLLKLLKFGFFYEKRPPEMDPENVYDRAQDRKTHPGRDPRRPSEAPNNNGVVERSNPGSRVLPGEGGHVDMGRWKVATLIRDIQNGCGSDLLKRSKNLTVKIRRVDTKNAMWHFAVPGSKETHFVRVQALRRSPLQDMSKAHVKVSCSCPFWQWQGPEHWAKNGDYLYGRPQGTATKPSAKDPNGQHKACKHVLAVLDRVISRKWIIPEPLRRKAGLRYLADSLTRDEVFAVFNKPMTSAERVAERYLQSRRYRNA